MQYWCIGDDWNSIIGITFEREVSGYLGILWSQNYRTYIGNKRKERQVLANRKNNNNELFAEEIGKSSLFILAWRSVIDRGRSRIPVLFDILAQQHLEKEFLRLVIMLGMKQGLEFRGLRELPVNWHSTKPHLTRIVIKWIYEEQVQIEWMLAWHWIENGWAPWC